MAIWSRRDQASYAEAPDQARRARAARARRPRRRARLLPRDLPAQTCSRTWASTRRSFRTTTRARAAGSSAGCTSSPARRSWCAACAARSSTSSWTSALGSPTFGRVGGLSSSTTPTTASCYVPDGFAHGFCVLSDVADVTYKVGQLLRPDDSRAASAYDDPDVGIEWPSTLELIGLRQRDRGAPRLAELDASLPFRIRTLPETHRRCAPPRRHARSVPHSHLRRARRADADRADRRGGATDRLRARLSDLAQVLRQVLSAARPCTR